MTDEAQRRIESRKVAIVDLQAVSHIAQVLRRTPTGGQVALYVQGQVLEDPYLSHMLETGLAVTYARVITPSRRFTPVPQDWVPSEHADLHAFLMDRRNRYHAHIDRGRSNTHMRRVSDAGQGWFAVGFPEQLTPAQLEELVELARKVHRRVDADIDLKAGKYLAVNTPAEPPATGL